MLLVHVFTILLIVILECAFSTYKKWTVISEVIATLGDDGSTCVSIL
jgi:hypothetical protein